MNDWKPILYMPMRPQERPLEQSTLFGNMAVPPKADPPACDHAGTGRELQQRLGGGSDGV